MARKTAQETQETIKTITDIALRHFGQYGYAETSLEAVVQEAGVTRGHSIITLPESKDCLKQLCVISIRNCRTYGCGSAEREYALGWTCGRLPYLA
ncbi:TetR family transcriptional regulator [Chloroflexi bacterium TSY]|nr:TetR family transcriptional regulator [Chloroflexi bacterium TSY]